MHGFKKTSAKDKLAKLGMKGVAGGGDPVVLKEAKKKTIGMISGEKVKPRLDRPARAAGGMVHKPASMIMDAEMDDVVGRRAKGGAVMAPAAAEHPMAVAAKNSGVRCGPSKPRRGG